MRARSWMAALALIAGTSIAVGRAMPASSPTDDQGQRQPQQADPARDGVADLGPQAGGEAHQSRLAQPQDRRLGSRRM